MALCSGQFQNWVKNRSERWGAPILEAPQGRRDDFVEPYFRKAKPDQVVVILKAREPARILIAIGNKKMVLLTRTNSFSCAPQGAVFNSSSIISSWIR